MALCRALVSLLGLGAAQCKGYGKKEEEEYAVWRPRLSALMDLYIHPLYVLFSKILSSILNSPAPIYHLYHPLSTLSTVGSTYHFI
jgi:hypothetical protein